MISISNVVGGAARAAGGAVAGATANAVGRAVGRGMTTALFIPKKRSIGGIPAQVTISEQERDELTITEHPVEQGAPINDHAYKRPSEVTIKAGWSAAVAGDLGDGNGMYGTLLSWQAALHPFDLVTGKRTYSNMLIQNLVVTTDNHSEWALMADITCRQVIIVKTKATKAAINNNPGAQADPKSNATPDNKGEQQATSVGSGKVSGAASAASDSAPGRDFGGGGSSGAAAGSSAAGASIDNLGTTEEDITPVGTQVETNIESSVAPTTQIAKTGDANNAATAPIPPAPPDNIENLNRYVY